jgi:glycosyltransferase involved in cell wall biosynthesis
LSEIPVISEWLRWVSEMPAAFRAEPEGFAGGRVRVGAVVADALETLTGERADERLRDAFHPSHTGAAERNRLAWVLATAHVLWHPSLREEGLTPKSEAALIRFLVEELSALSFLVPIENLAADEERREELVRRVLRACGLSLPNESAADRDDRLKQVDSLERHKVLAAAAERERRAREVREAMAKKASEEAAAKVSRE